jgi:hypothetical protein
MTLDDDLRTRRDRTRSPGFSILSRSHCSSGRRAADSAEVESGRPPAWPDALCQEMGRLLLLALLEMSHRVLRRVEKVSFERDRSVTQGIDIDLKVRPDPPVWVAPDGEEFWLVPLAVVRRRTLVNLSVHDETGHVLTAPSLRLTQQLDPRMVRHGRMSPA